MSVDEQKQRIAELEAALAACRARHERAAESAPTGAGEPLLSYRGRSEHDLQVNAPAVPGRGGPSWVMLVLVGVLLLGGGVGGTYAVTSTVSQRGGVVPAPLPPRGSGANYSREALLSIRSGDSWGSLLRDEQLAITRAIDADGEGR